VKTHGLAPAGAVHRPFPPPETAEFAVLDNEGNFDEGRRRVISRGRLIDDSTVRRRADFRIEAEHPASNSRDGQLNRNGGSRMAVPRRSAWNYKEVNARGGWQGVMTKWACGELELRLPARFCADFRNRLLLTRGRPKVLKRNAGYRQRACLQRSDAGRLTTPRQTRRGSDLRPEGLKNEKS